MSWILTATGRAIDIAMPSAKPINIMDIAWALAQLPRFVGHCRRPYSVAEHSLLVAEIADREHQLAPDALLCALLHDAHEAYLGDCSSPLKRVLGDAWYAIERRHEAAVRLAFDLHTTLQARQIIKHCDLVALATERRDLLPTHTDACTAPWADLRGIEPCSWARLNDRQLEQHGWQFWRDRFLDRFHELSYGRAQLVGGCSRHAPEALATAAVGEGA